MLVVLATELLFALGSTSRDVTEVVALDVPAVTATPLTVTVTVFDTPISPRSHEIMPPSAVEQDPDEALTCDILTLESGK